MSDKKHWITKLVPALAFAAGIIIASVGGIMTISSSMKLAFFETGPYSIITEDQCRFDYNKPSSGNQLNYERSPIEIQQCMADRKQDEITRFQNDKKENIVDGVSSLIIGGVLLLAFRRRK
jgi:hypothetical protein